MQTLRRQSKLEQGLTTSRTLHSGVLVVAATARTVAQFNELSPNGDVWDLQGVRELETNSGTVAASDSLRSPTLRARAMK
jgi:hypothetical protein